MSTTLADLPSTLADAVQMARAALPSRPRYGLPTPVITDPELRAWVAEYSSSGELAKALADVAASDPDLAD